MKRPHRSIETFDISLMAVVTKAMGAFLVLMLLLMPYYSSSPLGKDEAQDLARKVQDADRKIKRVLDKLGDQDLGKDLVSAREELGSGQQLIEQLKRYVDQLSAQVTRLEEKIVTLTAELDQLKKDKSTLSARVAELEKENADLKAENEKLKAEIERLNKRIAELEKKIEDFNKLIAELQKSVPEQVEELKKRIEELEKENARLKQENADLYARVAALEDELARLRARNAELEQQNAQLNALVAPLQQENAQLKATNEELLRKIAELEKLKGMFGTVVGDARGLRCTEPFVLGALSPSSKLQGGSKYIFNTVSTDGNSWADEFAGSRVSSIAVIGVPSRYFLYLIFREKQDEPLREAQQDCAVNARVYVSTAEKSGVSSYAITVKRGDRINYFADMVIGGDGGVVFAPPSPEGTAYLQDQIGHATFAAPLPAQPSSPPAPSSTEAPPAPAVPVPDSTGRRRGG